METIEGAIRRLIEDEYGSAPRFAKAVNLPASSRLMERNEADIAADTGVLGCPHARLAADARFWRTIRKKMREQPPIAFGLCWAMGPMQIRGSLTLKTGLRAKSRPRQKQQPRASQA